MRHDLSGCADIFESDDADWKTSHGEYYQSCESFQRRGEKKAVEMLKLVKIPDAEMSMKKYPHELSGGMRQRVMIAIALAGKPKVPIADEPTTALDVTIQAQILDLMKDIQKKLGTTIILIIHDLGVVASVADRIVVMYSGKIMEKAIVLMCSIIRSIRIPGHF